MKVYNSQTSEFNLTNDEINYSTQISSKKHAANKTKFFASRRLEADVAYECNPSVNTIFAGARKDPGSVPSNSELFLDVSFSDCKTTIHEDLGLIPGSGELFRF